MSGDVLPYVHVSDEVLLSITRCRYHLKRILFARKSCETSLLTALPSASLNAKGLAAAR